jgi:hypothetical protein
LAGYFKVNAEARQYDNLVKVIYDGKAMGIAWDDQLDVAFGKAISSALLSTLRTVRDDLNEILSVLEQGDGCAK